MRFKLTLFLIVANLVTFGLIWKNSGGNDATEISSGSLFSANIESVEVSAASAGGGATGTDSAASAASFSLVRDGRDWVIKSPFPWRANLFAVNRLLSELRFLDDSLGFSLEEVSDAGNSLSNYGLEQPAATVSVVDSAGAHELLIGKTTPDGRSVYVLSPDKNFIIPAPISLLKAISQTPDELRSREVFSMRPYEVDAVIVRSAFSGGLEQRIGLVRSRENDADGIATSSWSFETPISAQADAKRVEKQLGELTALNYTRFVSGETAPDEASGLRVPALRFTLEGANYSRSLSVGNPDPADPTGKTLLAKLDDNAAIFSVPAETVNAWRNAVRDLRDPYFFRFNPENLTSITIHADNNDSLVLHRANFSRDNSSSAPAGTAQVAGTDDDASSVGAIATPLPEIFSTETSAAINPIFNAWQMPVAPGSGVTQATNVEPAVIAGLVEQLRNLRAIRTAGADNSEFSAAQRRLCEAFVADIATPEDIVQMKFNTPLRIVELEFTDASTGKTKTQTLTIAPEAEKDTPIHAKTGTAIYSVDGEILDQLSTLPNHFRARTVYSLPAGGKIVGIKLSELSGSQETPILDEKCPAETATGEDWAATLEKNPEPFPQALAKLLHATGTVVAESYLQEPFSRDFKDTQYIGMGTPEPWRYKLEIEVALADGEKSLGAKTETRTYFLTRRLGGTTQIAGSPEQNCIFRIRQDFIDAMHTLTFNRSGIIPNIADPIGIDAVDATGTTTPAPAAQ